MTNSPIWVHDQTEKQRKWIEDTVVEIGMATILELTKEASKARSLSYSPYSHYVVGVALLASNSKTYKGANLERVSYSETVHAEETAVIDAMLDGAVESQGRRFITAVAVSHAGDSAPCGHCRQILAEHCDDCLIITADEKGAIRRITCLSVLMPYGFSPTDLGIE